MTAIHMKANDKLVSAADVRQMLRDAAFILRLTARVKADILGTASKAASRADAPARKPNRPHFDSAV